MKGRSKSRTLLIILATVVVGYGVLDLLVLPLSRTHHEHQKALAGVTMVTHTAQGIPGDPINVGLVGTQDDILSAMHAGAWCIIPKSNAVNDDISVCSVRGVKI